LDLIRETLRRIVQTQAGCQARAEEDNPTSEGYSLSGIQLG
jgi:hypothetical protein